MLEIGLWENEVFEFREFYKARITEGKLIAEKCGYPRWINLAGNEGNVIMAAYEFQLKCDLTSTVSKCPSSNISMVIHNTNVNLQGMDSTYSITEHILKLTYIYLNPQHITHIFTKTNTPVSIQISLTNYCPNCRNDLNQTITFTASVDRSCPCKPTGVILPWKQPQLLVKLRQL